MADPEQRETHAAGPRAPFVKIIKSLGMKILLVLIGLAVGFVFLEFATTALIKLKIIPSYRPLPQSAVYHDVLGYALPPNVFSDVDENGFRNSAIPDRVDVVAMGDSQTYGYNALSQDSWPEQLERQSGNAVYNMGIPGWGPAQYYEVADKALALHPRLVVIGFYLGNDISNACEVFALDYWKNFAKEKNISIDDCRDAITINDFALPQGELGSLLRRSNFLSFLRRIPAVSDFIARMRYERLAKEYPNKYFAVDTNEVKTIFALDEPGAKVGFDLPDKRKGVELTKFFYAEIIKKIAAGKSKLLVVFIPDKVDVYYDYLLSKGYDLPDGYRRAVLYQRQLKTLFSEYFRNLNVPTVDASVSMIGKISGGGGASLFSNNLDTHPTAVGYAAIAETVAGSAAQLLR